MLAEEYSYTPLGNIKTFWGYQTFLALDGGLTLLEESIDDSFMVASLNQGRATITCLTLWGVKVSWSHSSTESTLVPGGQRNHITRTILIAPISDITSNSSFVSHVNIYEQQLMSNAYIKHEPLDVLAKQNRKIKQFEISL